MRRRYWAEIFLLLLLTGCGLSPRGGMEMRSSDYPPDRFLLQSAVDSDRFVARDRAAAALEKLLLPAAGGVESAGPMRDSVVADLLAMVDNRTVAAAEGARMVAMLNAQLRQIEVWRNDEIGGYCALAVLDRAAAREALVVELQALDAQSVKVGAAADAQSSPLERLGGDLLALQLFSRRLGIEQILQRVDAAGKVPPPPQTLETLAQRIVSSAGQVRLNVQLDGDSQGLVRRSVLRTLGGLGMRMAPDFAQTLGVRGLVRLEPTRSEVAWWWGVADAEVSLVGASGQLLAGLHVRCREGSYSAERAEILARERLGKELATQLMARIMVLGTGEAWSSGS